MFKTIVIMTKQRPKTQSFESLTAGLNDKLRSFSKSPWLFPATLAITLVVLFADALVPGNLLAFRDAATFYPPLYRLVRDEWMAGRVPLWNPLLNGGQPLAGMGTSGAFYLPQLLCTFLLPEGMSLNVLVIGHLAFAAAGAFLLAREQSLSRPAATLAGLGYACCGNVFFQVYNPIYTVGAAWFVWAILAGWRLLGGAGRSAVLLLAVSLAMAVLGGEPQAAYHAGLVLGLFWLLGRGRTWKHLGLLAAAGLLGGLLSLPQVALAVEFAGQSDRAIVQAPSSVWQVSAFLARPVAERGDANWYDIFIGRPPKFANHYRATYSAFELQPWQFVEFFWPGFAGPIHDRWPQDLGWGHGSLWAGMFYAGLFPAIAASLFFFCRQGVPSRARPWKWLAILSLTLSFGGYGLVGLGRQAVALVTGDFGALGYQTGDEVGGLYWLLSITAPGYANFRYPVKWMTVCSLAVAQMAAVAGDQLQDPAVRRRFATCSFRLAGIIGLLTAGLVVTGGIVAIQTGRSVLEPAAAGVPYGWLVSGGLHAALVASALGVLLRGVAAGSPAATSTVTVVVLLTAGDLVVSQRSLVFAVPFSVLIDSGSYAEELEQGRLPEHASVNPRLRVATLGDFRAQDSANLYQHIWYAGTCMRAHLPWLHGLAKIGEASTAMDRNLQQAWSIATEEEGQTIGPRRIADIAAVEYLLVESNEKSVDRARAFFQEWSDSQKEGAYEGLGPKGGSLPAFELFLPWEEDGDPFIYVIKNVSALPRARIVRQFDLVPAVQTDDWPGIYNRMLRIAYPSPEVPDLFHKVILDVGPGSERLAEKILPTGTASLPAEDRVEIVIDQPQWVVAEAELTEPGIVVLADSFHPDWSLTVSSGGRAPMRQPILRANQLHRACWLPAGSHRLEFRYRSQTFARTVWPTLFAWLAVSGLIVWSWRQGQANGQP